MTKSYHHETKIFPSILETLVHMTELKKTTTHWLTMHGLIVQNRI